MDVSEGTAVGVMMGVVVPEGLMIPGVGMVVGTWVGAAEGEGVGDRVGSLTHPMLATAAPISRTARNIGDMCLLYRFNTIRVLPIELLEIS